MDYTNSALGVSVLQDEFISIIQVRKNTANVEFHHVTSMGSIDTGEYAGLPVTNRLCRTQISRGN